MTLLHQAAQKAVEALTELADAGADAWSEDRPCQKQARAAITALQAALQQQPEPVAHHPEIDRDSDGELLIDWAPGEGRMLSMTLRDDGRLSYAFRWDGETAHGQAQMPPSLQHQEVPCGNTPYDEGPFTIATDGGQEVPREPVARSSLPDPLGCRACTHPDCGRYDGPRRVECRAMCDNACARPPRPLAASPSTTRQQEVRPVFDELIAFEETCEVKPTFADAVSIALAAKKRTRQQEVATWLLYEHEDGHHAVAPTAEAATFAQGDPAWHRVGPVEVSSESLPYRSAAGDTLASIAQAELRDANRWPEILSLNTHVLDGAAGPASKPRAGTLLTLPSPSTARQQEVGSGLTVWFGCMPESNGKANWTAILHRGDISEGFTIDRSEHHDRVRYDADRVRYLIGELEKEPFILDYDGDMLSPQGWLHPCVAAAPSTPEKAGGVPVIDEVQEAAYQRGKRAGYSEGFRAGRNGVPAGVPMAPDFAGMAREAARLEQRVAELEAAMRRLQCEIGVSVEAHDVIVKAIGTPQRPIAGVSASGPHPLPAQANDGGEHG